MGQTMTEKILSAHAGKQVESGEYTTLCVDLAYVQDVSAVIAKGFARIFFRNCINVRLPAIILDTDAIQEGDELELDLSAGKLLDKTTGQEFTFPPLPPAMAAILNDGGLAAHIKMHGGFALGE